MSVYGVGIADFSAVDRAWDTSTNSNTKKTTNSRSSSGDTVEISQEAREILREKLGKYSRVLGSSDTGVRTDQSTTDNSEDSSGLAVGEKTSGTGGASARGGSSSSDVVENLKKQIEALKSQLTSLASQAKNGADSTVLSKINALEAQIAALEAQIAEAEQA
ncbi:MAG: hypothetical protein GX043_00395 [Desulfovibrionales bacterium]|nr:hypothetical protein [Desulfovibrionales bacterium]